MEVEVKTNVKKKHIRKNIFQGYVTVEKTRHGFRPLLTKTRSGNSLTAQVNPRTTVDPLDGNEHARIPGMIESGDYEFVRNQAVSWATAMGIRYLEKEIP